MDGIRRLEEFGVGKFDLSVFWAGTVRLPLIYNLRLIITSIIIVMVRPGVPIARMLTLSPFEIDRNHQNSKDFKPHPIFPMYNI